MRGKQLVLVLTIASLLVAACGGGDSGDAAGSTTTTTIGDADPTPTPTTPDDPTTTVAPAPTEPPTTTAPPAPAFSLDDLPDLLDRVAEAHGDPAVDPLTIAIEVTAPPVEVPVPEGSSLWGLEAGVGFGSDGETIAWDWRYSATAPGPVGDVDISLDDNGPGAVELRERYDGILGGLGYSYSNSTGSDPGETGGPNSINHVYEADDPAIAIAGATAELQPLFVWLDENLHNDDGDPTPGHRIDVGASLPAEPETIPVPLLAAIADVFPRPDGALLDDAKLRLQTRSADSFAAEWGLVYLTAQIEWLVPLDRVDEVRAFYEADPIGLDGPLTAAEPDFFEDGFWTPTEPQLFEDRLTQGLLLANRYGGMLTIEPAFGADGFLSITVAFDLEPPRPDLSPPAE